MKTFLMFILFSLSLFAQSTLPKGERKSPNRQMEKQESQEKVNSPLKRVKEEMPFRRGPYKEGAYQYEWKKIEDSGETP